MRTTLNAEMLVAVGPMGRDLAAFTNPLDALEFFEIMKPRLRGHYRRPDGETMSYAKASADVGAFDAWATGWAGNEEA